MTIDVTPEPYSTIVLHALKYPSKGVSGLLIGTKNSGKVKVTSAIPVTHESSPLAPSLEVALTIIHARYPHIIGVYFSNQNYKDHSINPCASRLAERVASVCGGTPLLIQLDNWQLSADCQSNCLIGHQKEGESWKEISVHATNESLTCLSTAIQQKLYRELNDFENHLDKPENDFYNTKLMKQINQLIH